MGKKVWPCRWDCFKGKLGEMENGAIMFHGAMLRLLALREYLNSAILVIDSLFSSWLEIFFLLGITRGWTWSAGLKSAWRESIAMFICIPVTPPHHLFKPCNSIRCKLQSQPCPPLGYLQREISQHSWSDSLNLWSALLAFSLSPDAMFLGRCRKMEFSRSSPYLSNLILLHRIQEACFSP